MIVRHLEDLKLKVDADWLLENFDFFNDYDDTCQYLRRMVETRPARKWSAGRILKELEKARDIWFERQNEDEHADPVWVLWLQSGQYERFPYREDAQDDLMAAESRGCRGIIYDDLDELKRDLAAMKEPTLPSDPDPYPAITCPHCGKNIEADA